MRGSLQSQRSGLAPYGRVTSCVTLWLRNAAAAQLYPSRQQEKLLHHWGRMC